VYVYICIRVYTYIRVHIIMLGCKNGIGGFLVTFRYPNMPDFELAEKMRLTNAVVRCK